MSIEVGTKVDGKVSGITNFGAFVDLGEHRSGLVHISEVSDSFVKDIHSVLKVGDSVPVMLFSMADVDKRSLSYPLADVWAAKA
ncbi:S1 RNA-binding domain-containing protein, partial [Pediococcus acidilactici]|nr:S1 RNA-binding domain-containing protein [Pediococcus acidilactici]